MGLPVPALRPLREGSERLLAALRLDRRHLDPALPLMTAGDWWIVPILDRDRLDAAAPDFAALRDLTIAGRWGNAILMTRRTAEPASAVHLRMFAPAFGIDEDPVTGSAQGPVAAYLSANGLLPGGADGDTDYVAEQGDGIGRAGRITTTVTRRAGEVTAIRITGSGVTVLRGTIRVG
jgi:PhzF family phenazine biosynthesis protein